MDTSVQAPLPETAIQRQLSSIPRLQSPEPPRPRHHHVHVWHTPSWSTWPIPSEQSGPHPHGYTTCAVGEHKPRGWDQGPGPLGAKAQASRSGQTWRVGKERASAFLPPLAAQLAVGQPLAPQASCTLTGPDLAAQQWEGD